MTIKWYVDLLRRQTDYQVTKLYKGMATLAYPPHNIRMCLAARYVLQQRGYIVPWIDKATHDSSFLVAEQSF